MDESEVIHVKETTIRYQASGEMHNLPVFLLLHGWTGDENSMWIFTTRLPKQSVWIAPRGFYSAQGGGYSWQENKIGVWSSIENFQSSIALLSSILTDELFSISDTQKVNLVGFSQGAALACSFMTLYPEKVNSLASLSGFLPDDFEKFISDKNQFLGKHVFIAHGTRDEQVPVEKARQAVDLLSKYGAQVLFCEDDVGHKLSASCFRSMEVFFEDMID